VMKESIERMEEVFSSKPFALAVKMRSFSGMKVHLVGIAGIGMARLALILARLGCEISGSDLHPERSLLIGRIAAESKSCKIFTGHDARNVPLGDVVVVYSSAVSADNCEVAEALKRGVLVWRRGQMLAELTRLFTSIVVCGSHGKTSTTALAYTALNSDLINPSLYLGGTLAEEEHEGLLLSENSKSSLGEIFVVESDESDRSFLETHPTFAVVTNIDHEHLESYDSFEELTMCFLNFVNRTPLFGGALLGTDDEVVRSLIARTTTKITTFGLEDGAQWQARRLITRAGFTDFDVWFRNKKVAEASLPIPGDHMVLNSLAAFALAYNVGVSLEEVIKRLHGFKGVHRRCELLGQHRGVSFLSDYAHHPVEVTATLKGLKKNWGDKVHVVFQPHRYTRTKRCWNEYVEAFHDAASLVLVDIYSAGEPPQEGITAQELLKAIHHPVKKFAENEEYLSFILQQSAINGDVIVFMGAGSVDTIARKYLSAREVFE
jgi:UDP-N-acetylmuramate--alanine ligase